MIKVKYIDCDSAQACAVGCSDPRGTLEQGKIYTADKIISGRAHDRVVIAGIEYNASCFEAGWIE